MSSWEFTGQYKIICWQHCNDQREFILVIVWLSMFFFYIFNYIHISGNATSLFYFHCNDYFFFALNLLQITTIIIVTDKHAHLHNGSMLQCIKKKKKTKSMKTRTSTILNQNAFYSVATKINFSVRNISLFYFINIPIYMFV